ncbi:hypothetical protein, partial [Burkholderia gladioli]
RGAADFAPAGRLADGFGFVAGSSGAGRVGLRPARLPERTGARDGDAGRGFLIVSLVRINA